MFSVPGQLTADASGVLWMGIDNKLLSFDGYNYQTYALPNGLIPYTDYSQVSFNYQDRQGKYWCYINNNGLFQFNPVDGSFTAVPFTTAINDSIAGKPHTGALLLEDRNGVLWIGLHRFGLFSIDTKSGEQHFFSLKDTVMRSNYLSANWINCGIETKDGQLYFGSNRGLLTFDGSKHLVQFIDDDPRFAPEIKCIITSLSNNTDGSMLVAGTWGTGIRVFERSTKKFSIHLTNPSSFWGNMNIVNDVSRLNDSLFFFLKRDGTANAGFGLFNINTRTFRFLEGLEPAIINRHYHRLVRIGDFIWINNIGELFRIYEPALGFNQTLTLQSRIPDTYHNSISLRLVNAMINDKEVKVQSNRLSLAANEDNFQVVFNCKGATAQDSILFKYRLKGYEKNWQTTYDTRIMYNNLPAGNYRLEITMDQQPYGEDHPYLEVRVKVAAHWWKTWWFRVAAALFILGNLLMIYRFRIRTIKEKARIEQSYQRKLAETEMKALRAQMNPHFLFNCLNSINRYIVKSDTVTASRYLSKFSKLIRHILDNSASGIIPLQKEIETLELYVQMEAMRFEDRFNWSITTAPELDTRGIFIPSMLVQPYVENAIWHGLLHKTEGECELNIKFEMDQGNQLVVTVKDNGIGRDKAAELKKMNAITPVSRGLQITRDRLELLKSLYGIAAEVRITDLFDNEQQAAGTNVTIIIPLIKHKPN